MVCGFDYVCCYGTSSHIGPGWTGGWICWPPLTKGCITTLGSHPGGVGTLPIPLTGYMMKLGLFSHSYFMGYKCDQPYLGPGGWGC